MKPSFTHDNGSVAVELASDITTQTLIESGWTTATALSPWMEIWWRSSRSGVEFPTVMLEKEMTETLADGRERMVLSNIVVEKTEPKLHFYFLSYPKVLAKPGKRQAR